MALDHRKKIKIKISGMTCAMCAATIEKSLINLNGVINAQVNLGNESVAVEYDFLKLKFTDLDKAIRDAGYQIINEKVVLKIGGMTCASCVKTIENSLLRLDGTVEVNIDLAGEKALVIYVPINLPFPMAYLMLFIATPTFIYISHPIFTAAYRSLKNKSLNMDVMYSMGIGFAFIASLLATFNFILSSKFLFYETAVFLATFLTMGRYLEAKAKGKTSEAIKKLMGLQPKTAGVLKPKNIDIEILYFSDCPNYNKSVEQIKNALKELNISVPLKLTEVTKENFKDYSFYGSPTILV